MPSSSSQHLLLARDALDKIIPLVKETWDTHLYANTCTALVDPPIRPKRTKGEDVDMDAPVSTSMPEGPKTAEGQGHMDIEWIESVREKERGEMGRLDTELKGYSSNLIKESMRVSLACKAWLTVAHVPRFRPSRHEVRQIHRYAKVLRQCERVQYEPDQYGRAGRCGHRGRSTPDSLTIGVSCFQRGERSSRTHIQA